MLTGLKNVFQNKEGYQRALPSLVLVLPDSKTFSFSSYSVGSVVSLVISYI